VGVGVMGECVGVGGMSECVGVGERCCEIVIVLRHGAG